MSCSITTHLAFVCCLRWRVPKMTCHLLQHFMLVSPGGILVITLSGLLVKISFDPNLLDGNLPGRQVALPPSHLCRFRQPLWPLLSPLVENYQIPDQGDEQLKSPVPKSSCWRSVWHILPIVRDSPSVAVTSLHIGHLHLQQKLVSGKHPVAQDFLASPPEKSTLRPAFDLLLPSFLMMPADYLDFTIGGGRNSEVCFRPVAGQNLRDGDWGQVENCVREESMRSGNLCEQIWVS